MSSLRLSVLLRSMDLPHSRRDVSKPENIRWMLRNIRMRNLDHPSIGEAVELLKKEEARLQ
jgi:hypothetical protein